jgi:hypothetical protein
MASENSVERLRAEVERRRDDLQTSNQRKAIAGEMARVYRVHEDFVLGFIEDVIGVARKPTREELERSQRVTRRDVPQAEDEDD